MRRVAKTSWTKWALGAAGLYAGMRAIRHLTAEDLTGKVVLITGGSRGLGLALAREFAAHGCRLALCGRDDKSLAHAAEELRGNGADVWVRKCDVSDIDQVRQMVGELLAELGQVDIVVNNAGIIQVGPLETMSIADFGRAFGTNFWGALHVIDAVLPFLRERRSGHIVNIVSIGGAVAVPHLLPYDTAKAALRSLSEGLAAELAKDNIRVSTVLPGLMRTGSPVNALFKGDRAKELAFFSAADCWPLSSMSADRAAKKIVAQARSQGGEIILSWQAKALRFVHALAPNTVVRVLGWTNRLLPDAPSSSDGSLRLSVRGMHVSDASPRASMGTALQTLADKFNQLSGHVTPASSPATYARPKD